MQRSTVLRRFLRLAIEGGWTATLAALAPAVGDLVGRLWNYRPDSASAQVLADGPG
jgi:hypothetical protein